MKKKTVFFDLFGTLVDIHVDEHDPWVYSILCQYLAYIGVYVSPEGIKKFYFEKIDEMIKNSTETHPDVDVLDVFKELLKVYGFSFTSNEDEAAVMVARLFRVLTRKYFAPVNGVYGVLRALKSRFRLGLIADAQRVYTEPEVVMLGLDNFFDAMIFSSDIGLRKPNPKIFNHSIKLMNAEQVNAVYIGDTPYRDIAGAKQAGMKMLLFRAEDMESDGFAPDGYIKDLREIESHLDRIFSEDRTRR